MAIVNGLALNENRQKFVVFSLSNDETYFFTLPFPRGSGIRHSDIVEVFCSERGFITPTRRSRGVIYEAVNREGVTLTVEGGGVVQVYPTLMLIFVGVSSSDYGKPPRRVVEHCVREAIITAGLHDYELQIEDVREE